MVTKYFGRFCNHILIGFKDTSFFLKSSKIIFTGTPLRKQFYISNDFNKFFGLRVGGYGDQIRKDVKKYFLI